LPRTPGTRAAQDAERFEEEQIAQLAPGTWKDGIAIPPPNFPDAAIKYIWDFFPPVYNCPLREKVGVQANNADGGKWVCGLRTLLQRTPCVVYSFGSNGEPTFELTLAKKTGCARRRLAGGAHIYWPSCWRRRPALGQVLP